MAIDNILLEIVQEAYEGGFYTSSNFAREKASEVAMAASIGYITTRVSSNVYGKIWRPTLKGLGLLVERNWNDHH